MGTSNKNANRFHNPKNIQTRARDSNWNVKKNTAAKWKSIVEKLSKSIAIFKLNLLFSSSHSSIEIKAVDLLFSSI